MQTWVGHIGHSMQTLTLGACWPVQAGVSRQEELQGGAAAALRTDHAGYLQCHAHFASLFLSKAVAPQQGEHDADTHRGHICCRQKQVGKEILEGEAATALQQPLALCTDGARLYSAKARVAS